MERLRVTIILKIPLVAKVNINKNKTTKKAKKLSKFILFTNIYPKSKNGVN